MNESCVGRTGKQKCCYGVGGLESVLYASRYQTCVGKVGAVVIHPTYRLTSHFSVQYLISNIMTREKSEQCCSERTVKMSQSQYLFYTEKGTVTNLFFFFSNARNPHAKKYTKRKPV